MVISNCRLGLYKEGFGEVENVYIKKLCKVIIITIYFWINNIYRGI